MRINEVYEGDCLDVMKQFPDNCIDTIITDPPYSLNFMNKGWDNEIAFNPAVWRECLRVAKPGATLMAFGGTRTYHRLACAIEDAGWQVRDCVSYFHDGNQAEMALMASLNEEQLAAYLELHYPNMGISWVYGSGFPKSHDVSKAIDKVSGAEREIVGYKPTAYPDSDCWGTPNNNSSNKGFNNGTGNVYGKASSNYDIGYGKGHPITAPSTPLAAKFSGWGSALKPAHEPIVLALKPMGQSYAENAAEWGVAGVWIDGGRIEVDINDINKRESTGGYKKNGTGGVTNFKYNHTRDAILTKGRWPANVTHSGEPGVMAEFDKAGERASGSWNGYIKKGKTKNGHLKGKKDQPYFYEGNSGSAARYFAHCQPDEPARFHYCPKAGPKERGSGNNHPTVKPLSLVRHLAKLTRTPDGGLVLDPFGGSGTTALACISEGRDYAIIDKDPGYVEIARRRIAEYTGREIAPKEIEVAEDKVRQLALW